MTRKLATMFLLMPFAAMATTWYVNGSSGSDYNSGTSQSSAKATIQAAIDASSAGDTILVAPGTYAPIDSSGKAISIRSTGGAGVTIIDGGRSQRCATLQADGCAENERWETEVTGFTFQHGYGNYGRDSHAGARGGTLKNCIFRYNESHGYGNSCGVGWAKAYNCLFYGNTSSYSGIWGGGVAGWSEIYNCTIVDNDAYGVWDCTEYNTIVWGNTGDVYISYGHSELTPQYSCFSSASYVGAGCVTFAPQFVDAANGDYRLAAGSPCIDAGGNSYVTGDKDLAGNARIANGTVDIGCYEYGAAPAGGSLTDGLVAYYPLDGNANDASGNGNHGTTHGVTLTADRFGNVNGAYKFYGYNSASYIEVQNSDSLNTVGSVATLSGWVRPDSVEYACGNPYNDGIEWIVSLLYKGSRYDRQYRVQIEANNQYRWLYTSDYGEIFYTSQQPQIGVWQLITLTDDGTTLTAYINGDVVGTASKDYSGTVTSSPLYIGYDPGGEDDYFNGAIDDVRIYNRALSAAEVKALYDGAAVAPTPSANGLWTVTQYNLNTRPCSISDAESYIVDSSKWDGSPVTKTYQKIAFADNEEWSDFGSDHVSFPGNENGKREWFAVKAIGQINVPSAGDWTLCCGSDDGMKVVITGNGFREEFSYNNDRSFSTTCKTVTFPCAGIYNVEIVYFEWGGAATLEFSVAQGSYSYFDSSVFKLVGDPASGVTLAGSGEYHTVTFDLNGADGAAPAQRQIAHGAVIGTLPTPTREGYEFLGWFTAKTDGSQADCWTEVYDNAIYYAQWRILSYTVTFDANGGAVGTSSVTRNYGASLGSLPVPSRTGHTFLGWYTSASGGSRVYETDAVTSSRTLYAHWQANTYTVTFNANGGDSSCSYSRTYGSSVGTLPTASRSGYVFKGWFTAASGGTQVSSSATVTGNATYYAHWATYAEEIAAALGTANVEFSTDTLAPWVPDGSSVCSGYVYHNGSSTMSVRLYGSGLLSFRWKVSSEPEYDTLTYSVDGIQGGRISGEQGWSSASILVAGAGWHTVRFTYAKDGGSTYGSDCGWVDSLAWTGSAPPVTNFTITFNANGGTVGTASVTRSQGAQLGTLPIPARTGYTFLGWFTSASGGVQVYASTTVSANATYYAHWQANGSGGGSGGGTTPPVVNYTVTFDGNGGSVDTLRVTRASGAAIGSMPVPEAEGYEFLGWFTARTGGVQVSTTDRVTANVTYYAHWRAVEDPNTLWDEDEAFDADAAAVFDGFLTKNDEACGVLQVKVGKANKRTGVAKLTAKVSLLGQPSKLSYKGVFGTPGAGDDFTPGVATLTCNGHPDLALRIGRNALWGELDDYEVEGARNVFAKAGDPLAAALSRWQGAYTLVLETVEAEGAGAANAWGYSGLTLTVGAKGKVKIQGTMVDGAKVNVASQLLVGENRCCIPVVAPLYAKKGGFGFNLWLQDDGSLEVGELGAWDATVSKTPFSAWFGENIPAARAGAALPGSLSFMFLGEPDIDGVEVLYDFLPWEVPVTTGSSWTLPAAGSVKYDRDVEDYIDVKESSNPAGLKLTYVSKTGAFKGSFKMYAVDDGGRLKKYTVKVSGVMVDGVGYGTASAKNAGSWPVSIQ